MTTQLFCIPHAGAAAQSYAKFQPALSDVANVITVELAGHGARMRETLPTTLAAHVTDLVPRIRERINGPFAFFGHSLGTLLSFEILRTLEADGLVASHAILSGRYTPDLRPTSEWYTAPDGAFLGMIRRIGNTDPAVFDHPDLAKVFVPILRADYQVAETFELEEPGRILQCPITALAGGMDGIVSHRQLARWKEFTSGSFRHELVPGGHFYLFDDIDRTARTIRAALTGTSAIDGEAEK
ncbi:MAG TPA: alpha/beta fold hydrolase [Propionicimonas sp.]|nr:alpha/beta fold hydrolase [Propionicimonas sp.]